MMQWMVKPLLGMWVTSLLGLGGAQAALASTAVASSMNMQDYRFLKISETGSQVFQESLTWQVDQWEQYRWSHAKPRACAYNLSKVLERAGLRSYSDSTVTGMLDKAKSQIDKKGQGVFVELPKADKQGIIDGLNRIYNGHIPAGTLVAGCRAKNCKRHIDGGQHIGMVGHISADGVLWIWHNNWLRKTPRSKFDPYMVSRRNMRNGYPRQWMPTPWLKLQFENGRIVDFKKMLPQIDDTDPNQFYITLAVVPEIAREIDKKLQESRREIEGLSIHYTRPYSERIASR